MKEMVTVTRVGDAIRISKVTAHGEEILEVDAETKALAILLWGRMTQEEPRHGTPLLPWKEMGGLLERLTAAVERLTAQIDNHAHAVTVLRTEFETQKTKSTPGKRGQ